MVFFIDVTATAATTTSKITSTAATTNHQYIDGSLTIKNCGKRKR
jgi:hypothetical protein